MPSGSGKADPLPGSARERRPVVDFLKMRSVQGKFLVYVVPLVLISTIVVFGLFEWTARKSAEQQLQVKLEKMIDIQSAVVAESLWNVADEQIKLILAALITDPDVVAAAVYDERDNLVAEVGDAAALENAPYSETQDIIYKSIDQQQRIGSIKISLTDARLAALTRERLVLAGVLAGILLLAVIAATLAANRRIIGKPLELLLESINRSQDDAPRRDVDWQSDDEIGRVVSAFNDMQKRQDAYEKQLRFANDELEYRTNGCGHRLSLACEAGSRIRALPEFHQESERLD